VSAKLTIGVGGRSYYLLTTVGRASGQRRQSRTPNKHSKPLKTYLDTARPFRDDN
jgi:hypothetical protein